MFIEISAAGHDEPVVVNTKEIASITSSKQRILVTMVGYGHESNTFIVNEKREDFLARLKMAAGLVYF